MMAAKRHQKVRGHRSDGVDAATSIEVEGWLRLPAIVEPNEAEHLADRCAERLASLGDDVQIGDKPFAGTRRLVSANERVNPFAAILDHPTVSKLVAEMLGPNAVCTEVTFRCPTPGFGAQKLHADDIPLVDCSVTNGLTAIMPLVAFTPANGSTRVVPGSHRRPDLQNLSGNLDAHRDEIRLIGEPGDMFIFSRHLLHSGTRNDSAEPRPALQISWSR